MKLTRWQQRFENFERAFNLLHQVFEQKKLEEFSDLEKEGIVQRFEYTFELAWKTLKDYLEHNGITLNQVTPRHTIKQGFAANIIEDGKIWINMLEQRNLMSHMYNAKKFEKAIVQIQEEFLPTLKKFYLDLKTKDID